MTDDEKARYVMEDIVRNEGGSFDPGLKPHPLGVQDAADRLRYRFRDRDGNPITLDTLCRMEPAWAANRIRELEEMVKRLLHLSNYCRVRMPPEVQGADGS